MNTTNTEIGRTAAYRRKASAIRQALDKRWEEGLPSTQRWLVEELNINGFPSLTESTLSRIMRAKKTEGCANEVLDTAKEILSNWIV